MACPGAPHEHLVEQLDHTLLGTDAPRALSNAIPRATFEIIAYSGHDLTLEQPLATATGVSQFFFS
jgi:pimeloyl-ACP methyl ester carboxylesterase